ALSIAIPLRSIGGLLASLRRPLVLALAVGLLAWGAGRYTSTLWYALGRFTFDSAAGVLRLAGQHVVAERSHFDLGIDDFSVHIAPSCAGYEGIGLILVFLGAFLWLEHRKLNFPRAVLLLPLGVAAVLVANILRIAALVALGRWVSPEMAEGGFHSKAGWVLYCGIALGIAALARRSGFFLRQAQQPADETWNPTAAYLGPLLALLATTLVTGLVVVDFDYLYPLRFLVVAAVIWVYHDVLPPRSYRPSWEAIALGVVVFALWMGLESQPDMSRVSAWQARITAMSPAMRAGWLFFRILGSVLTVPIAEELAFRGYLLRRLVAPEFTDVSPRTMTCAALLLSSVAFGALHQRWIAGTLAGLFYAFAQHRRGQLGDAIVAHAVTNALIAAAVLLLGQTWLWL
ncbi:MAG TPA: exosortase E/protease, VPEID-CTERM system, partial [Candidatus Acidoferrales bacterium]|nr:exosortase E/protease, VPEID-CTERM system [Candidatus Acidoferrales bacterium]